MYHDAQNCLPNYLSVTLGISFPSKGHLFKICNGDIPLSDF